MIKNPAPGKLGEWLSVAGTAVVIAAIIPGTTSTALAAMEAHMCYQIGKIYRGEDYTMKEAYRRRPHCRPCRHCRPNGCARSR